jgi:hypothetical protein
MVANYQIWSRNITETHYIFRNISVKFSLTDFMYKIQEVGNLSLKDRVGDSRQ